MTETAIAVRSVIAAIAGGLVGGVAMLFVMALMTQAGLARGNMVIALGGLITRSRQTAWRAGLIAHAISAVAFSLIYLWLIHLLGPMSLIRVIAVGAGIGGAHGLMVSLMLVWVVAEGHPFEEYNEAGLAVGLSHLLGHIVYGAVVGLAIGLVGG
jgi:hypothetical protein